jgi:hypothetical protein
VPSEENLDGYDARHSGTIRRVLGYELTRWWCRHGFSATSIRAKEANVLKHAIEVRDVILQASQAGTVQVDLCNMFSRFTFDVIFDLTLDHDLGAVR